MKHLKSGESAFSEIHICDAKCANNHEVQLMKFFRQQTGGVTLPFQKHPAVKPLAVKQCTVGHSSREERTQSWLAICGREQIRHGLIHSHLFRVMGFSGNFDCLGILEHPGHFSI